MEPHRCESAFEKPLLGIQRDQSSGHPCLTPQGTAPRKPRQNSSPTEQSALDYCQHHLAPGTSVQLIEHVSLPKLVFPEKVEHGVLVSSQAVIPPREESGQNRPLIHGEEVLRIRVQTFWSGAFLVEEWAMLGRGGETLLSPPQAG